MDDEKFSYALPSKCRKLVMHLLWMDRFVVWVLKAWNVHQTINVYLIIPSGCCVMGIYIFFSGRYNVQGGKLWIINLIKQGREWIYVCIESGMMGARFWLIPAKFSLYVHIQGMIFPSVYKRVYVHVGIRGVWVCIIDISM